MRVPVQVPVSSARPTRGVLLAALMGLVAAGLVVGSSLVDRGDAEIDAGGEQALGLTDQVGGALTLDEGSIGGGGAEGGPGDGADPEVDSGVDRAIDDDLAPAEQIPASEVEPVAGELSAYDETDRLISRQRAADEQARREAAAEAQRRAEEEAEEEAAAEAQRRAEEEAEEEAAAEAQRRAEEEAAATTTTPPAAETTETPAEETTASTGGEPAPAADHPDGYVDAGSGVFVPPVLLSIRHCESHDNYTAANPSSSARGAYQFTKGTWNGYGGYGSADQAPPAVQDQAALDLYNARGTQPWSASRHCWG